MSKSGAVDSPVSGGTCSNDCNGELAGVGEFMLFGVRVTVDSMRKSVSMNNLSQYVHVQSPHDESGGIAVAAGRGGDACDVVVAAGYASADDVAVHHSSSNGRERKRGVPWTEDEHRLFLAGLQKVGKGDWRGISRNFVKTRTPTQVASHAQKYFLRQSNLNRRRRRSSLFDISTDAVAPVPMEEDRVNRQNKTFQQHMPILESTSKFPLVVPTFSMPMAQVILPVPAGNPMATLTLGHGDQTRDYSTNLIRPIPIAPIPVDSTPNLTLNLRSTIDPAPLSLKLSLSTYQNQTSKHSSAFQTMSNFNNGDGIISVA